MAIKASVVIPVHNAGAILQETLTGLCLQSVPYTDFEVIVVDDRSTDKSMSIIETAEATMPLNIRVHQNASNHGTYASYNFGIARSQSPVVVLLDQDCVPDHKLIEQHLSWQARYGEHTAVMGRFLWHPAVVVKPWLTLFRPNPQTLVEEVRDIENLDVNQFITGNCSFRKEDLESLGGFDQAFTYGYGDTDLGYRWRRHSYRIVGNLDAIVYHYRPLTFQQQLQRKRRIGAETSVFCAKYPDLPENAPFIGVADRKYMHALYSALLDYFYHLGVHETAGDKISAEIRFADLLLQQNWDTLSASTLRDGTP